MCPLHPSLLCFFHSASPWLAMEGMWLHGYLHGAGWLPDTTLMPSLCHCCEGFPRAQRALLCTSDEERASILATAEGPLHRPDGLSKSVAGSSVLMLWQTTQIELWPSHQFPSVFKHILWGSSFSLSLTLSLCFLWDDVCVRLCQGGTIRFCLIVIYV